MSSTSDQKPQVNSTPHTSGGTVMDKPPELMELVIERKLMVRKMDDLSSGTRYKATIIGMSGNTVLLQINNRIGIYVVRNQILMQSIADMQVGKELEMMYDKTQQTLSLGEHSLHDDRQLDRGIF